MSNQQQINISFEFMEDGQEIICSATVANVAHNAAWSLKRFAHVAKRLGGPRTKGLMMQDALTQLLGNVEL